MRKETILIYDDKVEDNVEKEYIIFARDELIKYIQDNNINLDGYSLEVYAPNCFKCSIAILKKMNIADEFFLDEVNKEITLYMD